MVYVDDIIIIRNQRSFLATTIKNLGDRFSIKDLGSLHYFLGVKVVPTQTRIFFLSRYQYVRDLLASTNMSGAKDVFTPLSNNTPLKLVDGTAPVDSLEFRHVIGIL